MPCGNQNRTSSLKTRPRIREPVRRGQTPMHRGIVEVLSRHQMPSTTRCHDVDARAGNVEIPTPIRARRHHEPVLMGRPFAPRLPRPEIRVPQKGRECVPTYRLGLN